MDFIILDVSNSVARFAGTFISITVQRENLAGIIFGELAVLEYW